MFSFPEMISFVALVVLSRGDNDKMVSSFLLNGKGKLENEQIIYFLQQFVTRSV